MQIRHYDIDLEILPEHLPDAYVLWGGSIRGRVRVDLEMKPGESLVLALYRLLEISRLSIGLDTTGGGPIIDLPVKGQVEALPDMHTYQARLVSVPGEVLMRVAPDGGPLSVWVDYAGPICGAREAMPYVHDHVSERYTLLREEVLWYPAVYRGGFGATLRGQSADAPTYEVRVTCPATQTAVTGGVLIASEAVPAPAGATLAATGWTRYHWRADTGSFMGISCSEYRHRVSADGRVSLYCFPEDEGAADAAMSVIERTMALCRRWLGPSGQGNLNVAEIPAGWGSQSSRLLILQDARSLQAGTSEEGQKRLCSQLGHEVAHLWSVPSREPLTTRWLDEGMTHFMEALLLGDQFGRDAYVARMDAYRASFVRNLAEVATVPLAECGSHPFSEAIARGKGPWVLAVLRELVGDDLLRQAMTRFTQAHYERGATPADFFVELSRVTGRNLDSFYSDWFLTAVSSDLVASSLTAADLAARYR